MQLKLIKHSFWTLLDPNTREVIVHLTFKKPGPIKVDYENLAPAVQSIIDRGIKLGLIEETT